MDLRKLEIFEAINRFGSISAAADELEISQSAVSQQLKVLEDEVGGALFTRSKQGPVLTPAGVALLEHAQVISAEIKSASIRLDAINGSTQGIIRIACFPSASASLIPKVLKEIKRKRLDIDIRLKEAEPGEAFQLLENDEVDLVVTFTHSSADYPDDRYETTDLVDDELLAVLPRDHRLAGSKTIALKDLADEFWVAGCEHCRGHLVSETNRAGFTPDISQSTDDYVVAQKLVAAGLAVTLLPRLAIDCYRDSNVALVPVRDGGFRTIQISGLAGSSRVPIFNKFVEIMKSAATN